MARNFTSKDNEQTLFTVFYKRARIKRHATHTHEVSNSLSKAHSVHRHSYSIRKGKDQTDWPTELWAEAATDQEVGPACRRGGGLKKWALCVESAALKVKN